MILPRLYGHSKQLGSINISYTVLSFNFLKIISAFWTLIKEQLLRSAIVVYLVRRHSIEVSPVMKFDPTPLIRPPR